MAVRRSISGVRKFDGEVYHLHSRYESRTKANSVARSLRGPEATTGYRWKTRVVFARVVRDRQMPGWDVFVRVG